MLFVETLMLIGGPLLLFGEMLLLVGGPLLLFGKILLLVGGPLLLFGETLLFNWWPFKDLYLTYMILCLYVLFSSNIDDVL